MSLGATALQSLPSARAAEVRTSSAAASYSSPEAGPSVEQAADAYDADVPGSAAVLADAASPTPNVPLAESSEGFVAPAAHGGEVTVSATGEATLAAPGLPTVGIAVALPGVPTGELVDGALVQSEVAPATDVVTRATSSGAQVVAVMADASAPSVIPFSLDLPSGATLQPQPDGSIQVAAPARVETVSDAEMARVTGEIDAVLGATPLDAPLTAEQSAALDRIRPAETTTEVVSQPIATIAPAWAVDAEGQSLPTRYEVQGSTLVQVVETSSDTAFPVTADPSLWWWAWTATQCVANVVALFAAVGWVAKLARVQKIINSSQKLSAAVAKIGGLKAVLSQMKSAAAGIAKGSVHRYLSPTSVASLSGVVSVLGQWLSDYLGIGTCVSLIRQVT